MDKCICRVVWWISVYVGRFGGYVCIKVVLVDMCVCRVVWWISVY